MPQLGRMPEAAIGAQEDNKQLVPIYKFGIIFFVPST
jgi:hypothetical protein